MRKFVIPIIPLGPIVILIAAYIGTIIDGSSDVPDWRSIGSSLGIQGTTVARTFLVLVLWEIGLVAALAPVIYAVRANDPLTVFISLVLTGGTVALFLMSRTVMDQVSALIIFLANIILSAAVYLAHKLGPRR